TAEKQLWSLSVDKSRSQAGPAVARTFLYWPSDRPAVTPVPGTTVMIRRGSQIRSPFVSVVQFVGFLSYTRIRSLARSHTYRNPSFPSTRQWGCPPSPEAKLPRSCAVALGLTLFTTTPPQWRR